jgi:multidrug efflux pump subunit AcrA (membrane-fusion protein)
MNVTRKNIYKYLILVFLLTACRSETEQPTPTPFPTPVVPEQPTYTVQRGTVIKTLEFRGRVSPVTEQELFFEANGYVREVYVEKDELVRAGDLLAELEVGDLENQMAQAQITLDTTALRLRQAEEENKDALIEARIALDRAWLYLAQAQAKDVDSDVTIALINLRHAQQTVTDAQREYNESLERQAAWGEWGEPQERVDAYARSLDFARDSLTTSQASYDQIVSSRDAYTYTIQLQAKEVELAELRVEKLERGVDPMLAQEAEKAQLSLQRLQNQIEDARLVAPFDGRILSLSVREGTQVVAYKPMLILGDPGALEITAELTSEQLSDMVIDQEATIRLVNRPERDWTGYVRQLPYPYGGGAKSETDDTATRIALHDSGISLELGELATIIIFLEQKDDALWLPHAAIRSFQGRDFVVVQDGEHQRRVDVRLGLESEERVEILKGVEEGQVVIGP